MLNKKIQEYGENNFTRKILENVTINNWGEKETYWIEKLETHISLGKGYNLTLGGDGTLGYSLSEKTKEKIRKKAIGRKLTKETKEKIRQANKGKIVSEKTKKALSKPRKNGCSEERKRKISEATKGRIPWNKGHRGITLDSEETKKKKSENNKGKNNPMYGKRHTKESLKKMQLNSTGKKVSNETKEKIRKTIKNKIK
jgi:group I intron endonuclease